MEFVCDKCGVCCQSLYLSDMFDDLNDGTGICIYFGENTKMCTIYDSRPEKCNVKAMYKYFSKYMSYDEYIIANMEACKVLKEKYKNEDYR